MKLHVKQQRGRTHSTREIKLSLKVLFMMKKKNPHFWKKFGKVEKNEIVYKLADRYHSKINLVIIFAKLKDWVMERKCNNMANVFNQTGWQIDCVTFSL